MLGTIRKNGGNFLLRRINTVRSQRVRGKGLGQGSGPAFFAGLNLLEKFGEGQRIVTGLVKLLQAQIVGLSFCPAVELQELHGNKDAGRRARAESDRAA